MRLDNFVNERAPVTDSIFDEEIKNNDEALKMRFEMIILKLRRECSEIIREYKKNKAYLYRGYNSNQLYLTKTPRIDRRPMDMPKEVHDLFDNAFKKEFGWKVRSEGAFVTTQHRKANGYGDVYLFFPVNSYKYVYSPTVHDLFVDYMQNGILRMTNDDYRNEKIGEEYYDKYMEPYNKNGYWTTKNIEFNTKFFEDFHGSGADFKAIVDHMKELYGKKIVYNIVNQILFMTYIDGDSKKKINFDWTPNVKEDDYFNMRVEEIDKQIDGEIDKYMNGYKDYGLFNNIHSLDNQEISFKCDKFYIVRLEEIIEQYKDLDNFIKEL